MQRTIKSLNPYSNGICSLSPAVAVHCENGRLNPYSNGICSLRVVERFDKLAMFLS